MMMVWCHVFSSFQSLELHWLKEGITAQHNVSMPKKTWWEFTKTNAVLSDLKIDAMKQLPVSIPTWLILVPSVPFLFPSNDYNISHENLSDYPSPARI